MGLGFGAEREQEKAFVGMSGLLWGMMSLSESLLAIFDNFEGPMRPPTVADLFRRHCPSPLSDFLISPFRISGYPQALRPTIKLCTPLWHGSLGTAPDRNPRLPALRLSMMRHDTTFYSPEAHPWPISTTPWT